MAVSKPRNTGYNYVMGTGTGSNGSAIEVWLEWKETSYSVENNTSNVTVYLYAAAVGSSSTWSGSGGGKSYITINGTEYTIYTNCNYDFRQTGENGINSFGSKSISGIAHNADGSKSITIGARFTTKSSYVSGGTVSNRSVALTTIPRASSISSITSSLAIDNSTTGTISLSRASSSFTHTVTFKLGSASFSKTGVGASTTFTFPTSWLAQLPSSTLGTVNVSVQTYSGTTEIGSPVTTTMTATVPASITPTISEVQIESISDNATVSGWSKYVQGYSKARIKVKTAAAGNGSTLSSYTYTVGSVAAVTQTASTYTSGIITQTDTVTIKVKAKDARGRESAEYSQNITVYAYSKPSISAFNAFRSNSSGTASDTGTYIRGSMTYAYSSCGSSNTVTATIQYRLSSAGSWTTGKSSPASGTAYTFGGGNIATASTYIVRFYVSDSLGAYTTKTVTIMSSSIPFNIKANGLGIGIGKYAETDHTLDIAWDVKGISQTGSMTYYIKEGAQNPEWEDYNSSGTPVVRRWGPFVYLRGVVKPTQTIQFNGAEAETIGQIPAGFRPSELVYQLCQGSGTSSYLLQVNSSGYVFISRTRDVDGSQYFDATTSMWFPFSVSWLI